MREKVLEIAKILSCDIEERNELSYRLKKDDMCIAMYQFGRKIIVTFIQPKGYFVSLEDRPYMRLSLDSHPENMARNIARRFIPKFKTFLSKMKKKD